MRTYKTLRYSGNVLMGLGLVVMVVGVGYSTNCRSLIAAIFARGAIQAFYPVRSSLRLLGGLV